MATIGGAPAETVSDGSDGDDGGRSSGGGALVPVAAAQGRRWGSLRRTVGGAPAETVTDDAAAATAAATTAPATAPASTGGAAPYAGAKSWDPNQRYDSGELAAAQNMFYWGQRKRARRAKRKNIIDLLFERCCRRPKWMSFRGIRKLRRFSRNPKFAMLMYVVIIVNLYVMCVSEVVTDPCSYRYEGTWQPTPVPSFVPTSVPTLQPTPVPWWEPTPAPTPQASPVPTLAPSPVPSPRSTVLEAATKPDAPAVTRPGDCLRGARKDAERAWYVLCNQINDLCTLVFLVEVLLHFLAEGFRYFDKTFNQFDCAVVVVCVVDLFVDVPGISAARLFRLANLVNKSTRFRSLKIIISSISYSLGPLSGVVSLAMLFLFVFAVGGMQLYGLNLSGDSRLHFQDFSHAMMTVFVMFTGDGWSQIMYKIMDEEGLGNSIFFVFFIIYGMFGLSMLILATLISKFDCGTREDFSLAKVLPIGEIWGELKQFLVSLQKGSKRAQLRKQRQLEDLRRRGLAPPEKKEGDNVESTGDAAKDAKRKAEAEAAAAAKIAGKGVKKLTKAEKEALKKAEEEQEAAAYVSPRDKLVMEAKSTYFVQAEHTLLSEHPAVTLRICAEESQAQIIADNTPEDLNGPIGCGPCTIEPDGPLRESFLNKVVDTPRFENFILFCIVCACVTLAIEGKGLDDDHFLKPIFQLTDLIFLSIFVVECVLRIMHKGLISTNVAYLKDPWNQLDFFIVITDVVSTAFASIVGDLGKFRALRGFRALRPLRALKKAPELRAVVDVIANCLPVFINLAICSVAFYVVNGVLMLQLFAGKFWRCNDPSITRAEDCGGYFRADSLTGRDALTDEYEFTSKTVEWSKEWYPSVTIDGHEMIARQWYNAPRNFDSIGSAMLTLFEIGTLDHWVEVLFLVIDSPDSVGEQPKQGNSYAFAFLVIFLIIIGNFLLMNLLVCGVVVVYEKMKADSRHNPDLTRGQRELLDVLNLMIRTRPGFQQIRPDPILDPKWKQIAFKIVMFDKGAVGEGRGTTFELMISIMVLLNTITLALYAFHSPAPGEFIRTGSDEGQERIAALQETSFADTLNVINDVFSCLFVFEMLLKLTAFGPANYWKDPWNKFDFAVVWAGVVQTAIDGFMGIDIIPPYYTSFLSTYLYFDPKTLRILRVFRLVRVVRLLKGLAKYERVQSITQLVDTLQSCIKHIINVFGLWLLVTITFALMSMSLYGLIPYGTGISYRYGTYGEYSNFGSFPQALMSLFKVATLDNWTWFMRDVMQGQRQLDESPTAWIFFTLYLVITAFLFLNIFTAIVMDQCVLCTRARSRKTGQPLSSLCLVWGGVGQMLPSHSQRLVRGLVLSRYDFMARVTSKPRSNGLERQIMTFNQAATVSEEWSYLDPWATGFIDQHKCRKLLSTIGAPLGFREGLSKSLQLRHMRRMELRMTGQSQQVHYVDFFISLAVLRYRLQRKPLPELDLAKVRGKLALEILLAFPSINDKRLTDTGGLLSAVQAVNYIQGQYRGRILRKMMANGDKDGVLNYNENRAKQLERQMEARLKEDEDAKKAQLKDAQASKDKKKKGRGKDKKKK